MKYQASVVGIVRIEEAASGNRSIVPPWCTRLVGLRRVETSAVVLIRANSYGCQICEPVFDMIGPPPEQLAKRAS